MNGEGDTNTATHRNQSRNRRRARTHAGHARTHAGYARTHAGHAGHAGHVQRGKRGEGKRGRSTGRDRNMEEGDIWSYSLVVLHAYHVQGSGFTPRTKEEIREEYGKSSEDHSGLINMPANVTPINISI